MKFFLIIIALLGIQNTYAKTIIFLQFPGDDSRSSTLAQNPATPWKTISKLNPFFSSLNPGDNVYFNRGETFYGSILGTKSGITSFPITISAYGSGNRPIITGLTTLTNWTSVVTVFGRATLPSLGSLVNAVLLNDVPQELGRYPNSNATQ